MNSIIQRFSNLKNIEIKISLSSEGVVGATAALTHQKCVSDTVCSGFRSCRVILKTIFTKNHQNFACDFNDLSGEDVIQKLGSGFLVRVAIFHRIDHQDGEVDFIRYFSGRSVYPCSLKEKYRGRYRGALKIPNLGLSIFRDGILWDPATTFLDRVN